MHTWNVADRPAGAGGILVHGHTRSDRAALWSLDPSGLVRVVAHADGRQTAIGGFLTVASPKDSASWNVMVTEAAGTLWALETAPGGAGAFLRVTFGPSCSAFLSLDSPLGNDVRDESSVYTTAHQYIEKATVWNVVAG